MFIFKCPHFIWMKCFKQLFSFLQRFHKHCCFGNYLYCETKALENVQKLLEGATCHVSSFALYDSPWFKNIETLPVECHSEHSIPSQLKILLLVYKVLHFKISCLMDSSPLPPLGSVLYNLIF